MSGYGTGNTPPYGGGGSGGGGNPPTDFRQMLGMDPAAQWVLGPGFRFFAPPGENDPAIPVIILLKDAAAVRAVLNVRIPEFHADPKEPGLVILENRERLEHLEHEVSPAGIFISAIASRAFFVEAATQRDGPFTTFAQANKRIKLGLPLPPPPKAPRRPQRRSETLLPRTIESYDSKPVVIGIIDDAIAFANARFRRSDGTTRFEAFWIQDHVQGGVSPSPWNHGSELAKSDINTLITSCMHADWLDEDELYRRCGLSDFTNALHKGTAWGTAHGTHVLDLAGGYDMSRDRADRPIIGVQLPVASTIGQTGVGLETYVREAIEYIKSRAAALTTEAVGPVPIVINFSYATHDGPHDGTSLLEQVIDSAITDGASNPPSSPLQIVLPAGNTEQSRCHVEISLARGDEVELLLRLQPDNTDPAMVQFWLPCPPRHGLEHGRVRLQIESPSGFVSDWLEELSPLQLQPQQNGQPCGLGVYVPAAVLATDPKDIIGDRGVFRIDLNPTAHSPDSEADPTDVLAPSGVWTIRLKNDHLSPEQKIEGWVDRDDLLYGYPRRGRQAYFDDPSYRRFDKQQNPIDDDSAAFLSVVKRNGMVNAIGTGREPLVIGGYRRLNLTAADYSAGGPVTVACGSKPDGKRRPDALVVSDDTRVHLGLLASGTRGGSVVALNGTSIACARMTRWCANQLAQNEFPDRNAAMARAKADDATLPASPDELAMSPQRSGSGRIVFKEAPPSWRVRYWDAGG